MSEIVEFTSKDGHLGFLVFDYVARLKREAASIGSQPISTRYKNLPASRHQKAAHNFLAAYKKRDREITASDLKSFVGIDANFISELILNRVDGISFEDAVRRHFELIGRPNAAFKENERTAARYKLSFIIKCFMVSFISYEHAIMYLESVNEVDLWRAAVSNSHAKLRPNSDVTKDVVRFIKTGSIYPDKAPLSGKTDRAEYDRSRGRVLSAAKRMRKSLSEDYGFDSSLRRVCPNSHLFG